jgi:transposase
MINNNEKPLHYYYDEASINNFLNKSKKVFTVKGKINKLYKIIGRKYSNVNLAGAINSITGHVVPIIINGGTIKSVDLINIFKYIVKEIRRENNANINDTVTFTLDNATIHKTKYFLALEKELNIKFDFLPPYCPQSNLFENYISLAKRKVNDFCNFYMDDIIKNYQSIIEMPFRIVELAISRIGAYPFFKT